MFVVRNTVELDCISNIQIHEFLIFGSYIRMMSLTMKFT